MLTKGVIESIEGLVITVNDRGKYKKYDLGEIFGVDENNLAREFAQQASLYAYFATLQTKAEFDANVVETGLEQEQAAADSEARKRLQADDIKFTEAVIKGMVALDEECAKLQESLLEFRYDAKLLKAICTALEMRANMLVSMGSHIRHEIDQTSMKIREAGYNKSIEDAKKSMAARRKKV